MMRERPRRTRRAERTSDVTRVRGLAVAAAAAAAVVIGAALLAPGATAAGGAPGPLPRPHARAGVTCEACHDAPTLAAACTGCHGAHPSARPAHQALAARGALGCPTCHAGHAGGGVALEPDGRAIRYGAGAEHAAGTTRFRPRTTVTVPIVSAGACARCHDLGAARDPLAACLVAGQRALGSAQPTVCFDEHRPVRAPNGTIAPRAAAWDAAREIAATAAATPARERSGVPAGPWWWLGAGGIAGALALGGARRLDPRRRRAAPPPPAALPAPVALRRLPVIDAATCLGCYACVDACPYDVLEIHRYVAVVARPADCCGLILCEQKCPNGSLAIALADRPADTAATDVDADLESRTVPGLYLAGDVTGQPLIRTAIDQGARAVRAIAARPRETAAGALDVLIVGAGPAGLSAALEAQRRGLRHVALEQATIAESIRSFPRGKLVIDPDLPTESLLWLAEATKEELLARWTRTVREARPAIREGWRVTGIAPAGAPGSGFVVEAVDRDGRSETHRAARVLVAIGRRGTPRRLPIELPADILDHVHYSLADARSFAGRRVLVVGLGDVAMEAAIALSRQPGTTVTIAARGPDFRRGKARNIAEIRRRAASGTLAIHWRAEVAALAPGRATLATPAGPLEVGCDAVFVLIGAIPPEDLLRRAGVLSPQIVPETPA